MIKQNKILHRAQNIHNLIKIYFQTLLKYILGLGIYFSYAQLTHKWDYNCQH